MLINYAKAFHCVDHSKLWKILKEMGMTDHLTYLLRNLYAGQETTVRTGHGTMDWLQVGKGVYQGCILSPCLFNLYAENTMQNPGLGHRCTRLCSQRVQGAAELGVILLRVWGLRTGPLLALHPLWCDCTWPHLDPVSLNLLPACWVRGSTSSQVFSEPLS